MKKSKLSCAYMALLSLVVGLFACGVKGPPLPPIPASAETSDRAPEPNPSPTRDEKK